MIMTTYSTRTLAEAVIGDAGKQATRTLRKFLRDDTIAKGGKVGIDTPGKGGRYALELKAPELRAMKKRFIAWETAQEAAKVARAEEMAKKAMTATAPIAEEADTEDDAVETTEGPTDEEIAAMLSDEDDEVIED